MGQVVYLLCAITSFSCAALLFRANRTRPSKLLFGSAVCFIGLFLNNLLLVIDLVFLPDVSFAILRSATAAIAVSILVFALVWDAV